MDDHNDLLELPGDVFADRAGVAIYRFVRPNEAEGWTAKGWRIVGSIGDYIKMRLDVEEYAE